MGYFRSDLPRKNSLHFINSISIFSSLYILHLIRTIDHFFEDVQIFNTVAYCSKLEFDIHNDDNNALHSLDRCYEES